MFSIIVPTHDRPLLLQRTLHSLLAQTWTDFEVIIVSDSASYLPPYHELQALSGRYTHVIRSDAPGPSASRNLGLKLCQKEYVIFLDDDDTLGAEHLAHMAKQIRQHRPELLFCNLQVCQEDRTQHPPVQLSIQSLDISHVTKSSVYVKNQIPNSCLVYRRDIAMAGTNRLDMKIYEDWDYLLQCLKKHRLTHVPVDTVIIHKTAANAPENMRRGNSQHELTVETMLDIYKNHPAPDLATRKARQQLLASAGIELPLELF